MSYKETKKSFERAKKILPLIIKHIKLHKGEKIKICYSKFSKLPGVDIHFRHLGIPLGHIKKQAETQNLPHINSIIVNKRTNLASIYKTLSKRRSTSKWLLTSKVIGTS